MEIEPDEQKWLRMRARVLSYHCDDESAIKALEEILAKDPTCVEAYHYLVMVYYDSIPKLLDLEKRITEAIVRCKKEKKKTKEIRDFKLLIAQIRVMVGNPDEAIRICEDLSKEDPEDFRIYMFQGLVYMSMKKRDEANKQMEQAARWFPEDHPYVEIMNTNTDSEMWRAIVAYDEFLGCFSTVARLLITSTFGKSGVHWFKRGGNQSFLKGMVMLVTGIRWFIQNSDE